LGVYTPDELEQPAGEKFMGPAEEVKPPAPAAPTYYDAAEFDKNFPVWSKAIAAGKKTPHEVIQTVETKGLLTEEQKAKVLSVKAAKPAQATDVQPKESAASAQPAGPSYAEVADQIARANSHDELAAMDELIGSVENAQHRQELAGLLAKRRDELPF